MLLTSTHNVIALDVNEEKVANINVGNSPIVDAEISKYLATKKNYTLMLLPDATTAYQDAEYVIIATSADYDTTTPVL